MVRRGFVVALLLIFGVPALLVGAYLLLPAPVTSKSLGYSVADEAGAATWGAFEDPRCERIEDDGDWFCEVEDPSRSGGGTTYEVTMAGWSCWEAARTGPKTGSDAAFPATITGCVKLSDYVRLGQRILD